MGHSTKQLRQRIRDKDSIKKLLGQSEWVASGCLEWTGKLTPAGYSRFCFNSKSTTGHRAHWLLVNGPIKKDLVLDHLCRNKICINLEHLEVVTSIENVMRGVGFGPTNAAKTHCLYGHPLTKDNLYNCVTANRQRRICKKCKDRNTVKTRQKRRLRPDLFPNHIPKHGTLSEYINWGCRCVKCKRVNRETQK